MKLEKVSFSNYKLLKDLEVEFGDSNIYFIQGQNNLGKTSFVKGLESLFTASNDNKTPVSFGEKEGVIKGYLTSAKGHKIACKFEFSNSGSDKFTLVDETQEAIKKVTDIRNVFKYNSFTAEEFVAWGLTADGRRKQRDIVLSILPKETQEEFTRLLAKEKELYDKRTELGKEVKMYEKLQEASSLTKEETELLAQEKAVEEQLGLLEGKLVEAKKGITKESIIAEKEKYSSAINTAINIAFNTIEPDLLKDLELECNKVVKIYDNFANAIVPPKADETVEALTTRIEKGKIVRDKIIGIKAKVNPEHAIKLEEEKTKYSKCDNELTETREAKDTIFTKADIGIEGIRILEDGIHIQEGDNLLEFNADNLSTSRIMMITVQIMVLVNKTTPILLVGRCESFDKDSLNKLAIFAKDNNCQIFMDKVIESGELTVVGYDDVEGKSFKQATPKPVEDKLITAEPVIVNFADKTIKPIKEVEKPVEEAVDTKEEVTEEQEKEVKKSIFPDKPQINADDIF